jgi:hypothetical protein
MYENPSRLVGSVLGELLDCASGATPDSVAGSASMMDGIELSAWDRLGAALKPSVGMLVGIRLGCGVGSAVGVAECSTVGGEVAMVGLLVGLMDSDSEGVQVDGSSLGDQTKQTKPTKPSGRTI